MRATEETVRAVNALTARWAEAVGAQAAGAEAVGAEATGAEAVGTKTAGTQAVGTKTAGTQAVGTKTAGTEAVGAKAAGTQAAGAEAAGTDATGPIAAGTKAGGAEAAGTEAAGASAASRGTVFSAVGVWPLLAFLADGAAGAARAELAEAVGMPAGQAGGAARGLLATLGAIRGVDSALGLWTTRTQALRKEWVAGLPADAHGVLTGDPATDREALDAWAAKRTGGLVGRMPVALTEDTALVLANALAVRTDWPHPFTDRPLRPDAGPWQGRTLLGLHRSSPRLDRVGVTDTPAGFVTRLTVPGDNGIDVHLLLGEERMAPGQVLQAGTRPAAGRFVPGSRLPYGHAGPGLLVEQEPCTTPQPPLLDVRTVAYDVSARHDLLALHRLFGLTAARDAAAGHFPGISDHLAVGSAGQSAVARFSALGFRAAAVTAVAAVPSGVPRYRHRTTVVRATYDRPFGFLAVHRETRLVLTAGWVTDPVPYPGQPRRS